MSSCAVPGQKRRLFKDAGRVCPVDYHIPADAFAGAPQRSCEVLYVVGGLYGNLFALNEFLISKQTLSGLIDIEAKINGWSFNTYFCDSLIVGTPTGSTAYNISVGGSVVYPHCKNILLTPVAPHSLTQRPLIVDSGVKLEFGVREKALLIIDGQESIDILPQDRILIQQSPQYAHLIYPKERNYFQILREKFKWGEL